MTWFDRIRAAPTTRLTSSGSLSPQSLLLEARRVDPNITLDELTGSRLIASEFGSGSPAEMCCIVDAELNRAKSRGQTLTQHLVGGSGLYGPQGEGGREAATPLAGNLRHLTAARAAMRDARGISRGARRFYDPKTQDIQWGRYRRGEITKVHSCNALGILSRWSFDLSGCRDDGLPPPGATPGKNPEEWVGPIPGVDAYRLMLFRAASIGPQHLAQFNAAAAVIASKKGAATFFDEPAVPLYAALLLAAVL